MGKSLGDGSARDVVRSASDTFAMIVQAAIEVARAEQDWMAIQRCLPRAHTRPIASETIVSSSAPARPADASSENGLLTLPCDGAAIDDTGFAMEAK